jgi:hypothetical protein
VIFNVIRSTIHHERRESIPEMDFISQDFGGLWHFPVNFKGNSIKILSDQLSGGQGNPDRGLTLQNLGRKFDRPAFTHLPGFHRVRDRLLHQWILDWIQDY